EDALVRVDLGTGVAPDHVAIRLNGRTITSMFRSEGSGLTGLVNGLSIGANALDVFINSAGVGSPAAQLTLVDHPITGPILSAPPIQPFLCRTHTFLPPHAT